MLPFNKFLEATESKKRLLIIVGNDLEGDSRVQKIVMSSIEAGNKTTVLARVSPTNKPPAGLKQAKIIRVPFHVSSQKMHLPFNLETNHFGLSRNEIYYARLSHRPFDFFVIIKDYAKLATLRTKHGYDFLVYSARKEIAKGRYFLLVRYSRTKSSLRRNRRRVRRFLFNIAISKNVPWPFKTLRDNYFEQRNQIREFEKLQRNLMTSDHGHENSEIEKSDMIVVPHTDFSEYFDKMHSWFIAPAIRTKPDIIHANDADTLSIAIGVKEYWDKRGHNVAVVYDSHEFTSGVYRANPTWLPAMEALELQFVPKVDAVITVSETIASLLAEKFKLEQLPTVVLNAPSLQSELEDLPFARLRDSLELDENIPLFVYVGVSAHLRGIHTAIEALTYFPEAHLALVTKGNSYLLECKELASRLGVNNRLHIKPYVHQQLVSLYISDATAGISPILHHPNHEYSCFTKFYEFLHSRLPVVTSDVQVMKETTLKHGVGTVFLAGDAVDCARQMKALHENINTYKSAITQDLLNEFSWNAQELKLASIYEEAINSLVD